METSFYDDENSGHPRGAMNINKLKSKMTLDFASGGSPAKRQKVMNGVGVLGSPDLNLLKLASPELERMIIQQNGLVTTTPTPTQFLCPKYVTDEQEAYARGFVDALEELHKQDGSEGGPLPMPGTAEYDALGLTAASGGLSTPAASAPQYTTMQNVSATNTVARSQNSIPSSCNNNVQSYTTLSTALSTSPSSMGSSLPPVYAPASNNVTTTSSMSSMPQQAHHHPHHNMNSVSMLPATVVSEATSSFPNAIVSNGRVMQLKEEPQLVPCMGDTPPISPINMDHQEVIKVERKRERNRLAARKCRTRKLERISRLEDRVSDLKGQNSDLVKSAKDLRDQVCKLKEQIMTHVKSGCQVMLAQNLL